MLTWVYILIQDRCNPHIRGNIRLQIADAGLRQELHERYPESLLDQMAG